MCETVYNNLQTDMCKKFCIIDFFIGKQSCYHVASFYNLYINSEMKGRRKLPGNYATSRSLICNEIQLIELQGINKHKNVYKFEIS